MTTSVKEKPGAAAEEEPAKGGGKKKLIIILVVVLLLAGGGAYFFLGKSSAKAAPTPGAVLSIDPVAVNLAGGGYLKVGVALQLTAAVDPKAEPDPAKATDLIITEFSEAKLADVIGSRDALKADLLKKITKAYGPDVVMGLYYTNYVTQ